MDEVKLQAQLQRWADGKATLKDVRGYTNDELYTIAKTGYLYYFQGKLNEARTVFQGLYAINPADPYFAKALGVVEFAAGNAQGAVAAYDIVIKLSPEDTGAYVGRAEVRIALGQKPQAVEDLRRAQQLAKENDPQKPKISAMLAALGRR